MKQKPKHRNPKQIKKTVCYENVTNSQINGIQRIFTTKHF